MKKPMKGRTFSLKFVTFLFLFIFLAATMSLMVSGQTLATVSVSPSSVTSSVYQNFMINLTVSGVSDLYGWEVTLTWNGTFLNALNVAEGPFLRSGGGTTFFTYIVNSTDGSVLVDCTLTGNVNGVSGGGTLATVTFYVNSAGGCPLHLSEATLVDSQDNQIPSQTVDGYGSFVLASGITTLKTAVGRGFSDSINVTVVNSNGDTEAFNVTLYVNTTAIGSHITSSLPNGNFTVLPFIWNTTNFVYSSYNLSAALRPVPGGGNSTSSSCTGGNVIVTIPGDINGDFKANLNDLVALALAYSSTPSSPNWNANADIDGNGVVGLNDLVILALHYGQHYP